MQISSLSGSFSQRVVQAGKQKAKTHPQPNKTPQVPPPKYTSLNVNMAIYVIIL